jgi:hypothetical protein
LFDEIPNVGISIIDGGLSTVSFLGSRLEDNILRERVLSFNFSSEQIHIFPTPKNVDGDPILCNLSNKLCCSFYNETTLRIFQARSDHTWQLTLHINSLPNFGVLIDFFPIPIGTHRTKLLVAFVCWLNPRDGIPPEIPVDAPNFFNLDHGLFFYRRNCG